MKLSVVMPVYNERATLREVVQKVLSVPMEIELICVDDGSRDGSREILALFIHLTPILAKDLFSAPNGIDRAGQGRDPGDGAGDVKQRCVGEGGDHRGDPAGRHHAARYSQPTSCFSEQASQLFLYLRIRHLLDQGELEPLEHLLTLCKKSGNHRANLHFDNRLTHTASLATRLYASRSELG